ncbi:LysR family transcriptional regulator [Marinobacter nanhaiticus D15-8W]|uniref:LysR family transcriptional regulator n=1 Tax=Marinobacter nanhaiticus D15-8W TaxID=626887 RepID=N6WVS7_9GAMM|nr:LysR family transcriptional regulator [Marinobacter nanhaiticus]ENO12953.1 LysR family transcriptional regulator [Marinobacter nanhaiticus D15-8W]BES70304.1 LysR family transcriptional regulator [Marinobacter nanhaiticus D15-8W]
MSNLNDLRLFVEAARQGSLRAAARKLERTPAAASAALKRLEAELGVKLIERNTRHLRLTPEGQLYRERIAAGLALIDEARHAMHYDCAEISGEIRVTTPVDFAHQFLRPLMNEFQCLHPQVSFVTQVGDSLSDLVSEPLDVAIRYGELPDSALVARRLLENSRLVLGSPDYFERHGYPAHPNDLLNHNCLIYQSRGQAYRRWSFQRSGETVVVEVNGDRTCNDGAMVREWLLDGVGVAYISELDSRADLTAGRLVPAFKGWLGDSVPISAVYPGTGPRPVRVKRFVEFLEERLANARSATP